MTPVQVTPTQPETFEELVKAVLENFDSRTAYTTNDLQWSIAEVLDAERQKQGLSLRGMAKKMGTSISSAKRLLRKDGCLTGVTLRTIVRAVDALGMQLEISISKVDQGYPTHNDKA